ncbi:unnamed protein product [Lymnaea stagnalis]|uniref:Uncharacterized protein n=1 Tax=Lymnaea stagnalis TaxID=6523 RepID=A0AAV2HRS4_LYMST
MAELFDSSMEAKGKWQFAADRDNMASTHKPYYPGPCLSSGHRRCVDGSCIASVDLCPEEQQLNQNTIVIMLVVGMAVIIILLVLYCYKQRSLRRRAQNSPIQQTTFESGLGEADNSSLNMPPPTYDEVINTNLYPPTPIFQRNTRTSYGEEPRTPPPNYDAALDILAHSQELVFPTKSQPLTPVVRRSVSTEFSTTTRSSRSSDSDYRRIFSNPDQR